MKFGLFYREFEKKRIDEIEKSKLIFGQELLNEE